MSGPASCPAFGDWEPQPVTTIETIDPSPVAALCGLLDSVAPPPEPGDVLPPLWHWVALPRWSPSSVLGVDGHPRRGGLLPPIDLPRRMFAGGEVIVHGDLRIGDQVEREVTVESIEQKDGRSGRIVIVRTRAHVRGKAGEPLIEERQDLVYRQRADPQPSAPLPDPGVAAGLAPAGPALVVDADGWRFVTDPSLLMRFSAATANAHRIHYDWPYATRVEGYPGLVVHGPLSVIALAETLRLSSPDTAIRRIEHRLISPLFCGEPARISHIHHIERNRIDTRLTGPEGRIVAELRADPTD